MEAIEELEQLGDAMRQAAALLADEDVDDGAAASSKRPSTFLNAVALGNTVSFLCNYHVICDSSVCSVICVLLFFPRYNATYFGSTAYLIFLERISICQLDVQMHLFCMLENGGILYFGFKLYTLTS